MVRVRAGVAMGCQGGTNLSVGMLRKRKSVDPRVAVYCVCAVSVCLSAVVVVVEGFGGFRRVLVGNEGQ